MKIKDGYNGDELEITVCAQDNGSIELWIKQQVPQTAKEAKENGEKYNETLSYMTADELVQLFNEIKNAGRDLFS